MHATAMSGQAAARMLIPPAAPGEVWRPKRRVVTRLRRGDEAMGSARRLAVDFLPTVAGDRAHDLALVTSELVDNAVRHGTGRRVELEVGHTDQWVRVAVRSWGPAFSVVPPPHPSATSGRGLLVVDRIARRWAIERTGGLSEVWAVLDLS